MLFSHGIIGTYRPRSNPFGRLVGLVFLGILLPITAPAQEASVQTLIEQGEEAGANAELLRNVVARAETAGLDPEQTVELLRPAVSLAERDLPATPLLNKTLEGLSKQVPATRMTPVLQQFQRDTERSGDLVSTWMGREEVKALAGETGGPSAAERTQLISDVTEAQRQDVSLDVLQQFLDALPEAVERRPVSLSEVSAAVSVMPDLPSSGDHPEVTQELLMAALNAGYEGDALRQLPAALEHAQQETQRPAAAVARGAAQAIDRGAPAASVLRSLFQGTMPGNGPPSDVGNELPGTLPGQGKPPRMGPPDDPGGGDLPPDNPGGGPPEGGG